MPQTTFKRYYKEIKVVTFLHILYRILWMGLGPMNWTRKKTHLPSGMLAWYRRCRHFLSDYLFHVAQSRALYFPPHNEVKCPGARTTSTIKWKTRPGLPRALWIECNCFNTMIWCKVRTAMVGSNRRVVICLKWRRLRMYLHIMTTCY